jgi:trimethylguanosine synthase
VKPPYVSQDHWDYRYSLFSRYDDGIQMDEESWYSVTHQAIAEDLAAVCQGAQVIMDGFAGVGGNVIQFARSSRVVAVEIDPAKVEMLRSNAKIYGVSEYIRPVVGNFFTEGPRNAPVDVLFMSPPWGGPHASQAMTYDIFERIYPPIRQIARTAAEISRNIILYLPRNADPWAVLSLLDYMPELSHKVEFRVYFVGSSVKTVAVLFGDFVHLESLEVANALLNTQTDNSTN